MYTRQVGLRVLLLCIVVGISLVLFGCTSKSQPEDAIAKQTIENYISEKNLGIKYDSEEYRILIKDILFNEYPEITNGPNGEAITAYAVNYLGYSPEDSIPKIDEKK